MTVVQNTATDPAGNPLSQISVRINLVTGSPATPGYTGSGDIIGSAIVDTNQAGFWTATLTPNASITPANTYYQVYEGSGLSNIVVPATGGPYLLESILVTPPPIPAAVGITGVQVAAGGTVAGVRPEVNLIAGTGVGVSAVDNPGANRVDVTLTATGSGELLAANNLSDVQSASQSRSNLGLGTAATQASSAFDAAGAAAAETTRALAAEALLAPLASPALTGTPTAPTKPSLTNTTALATTAYADAAVAVETSRAQTAEALKAPLASPAFTGSPTAPTQTTGDSSTKLATDAFVATAAAAVQALIPTSWSQIGAAEGLNIPAVQTAAYTMAVGDYARFDISGGSVSQPLPQAPANGTRVGAKVVKTNAGLSNTLTLACQGTDVINIAGGSTSLVLSLLNQGVLLQYQSGVWTVQSDDLPLGSLRQLFPDWLNVKAYGAQVNGKQITDATIASGSNLLNSAAQAQFTLADVGKILVLPTGGTANGGIGTPLAATITGWNSATQVVISVNAVTAVTAGVATYGSDDHAYLQAAITACQPGQTVFVPYGIAMTSAELSIAQPMRLTGDGATICTTNSAGINFQNTYITAASGSSTTVGLEIDHLVFDVAGGHVFYNCNWNKFSLHDLRLVQRSYNYAVWYSTAQNLLDTDVRNIVTRVYGNPRTVQAWYLKSALGGGIAMAKAQNCLFQNNDLDTSQYFVWIECEDATNHSYTNDLAFEHCWFDSAYGGCVRLVAVQGAAFRSCNIIDSYSATWGNSAYYIGAATSNGLWASQKITFVDCGRDLSGPNGTSTWDIECESTTDSVTIQNYAIRDTVQPPTNTKPQFNLHGCTNVVLINDKYRIITNAASTSVELLDGNVFFTGALNGASQPPVPQPGDAGYQSWPYLPELISSSGSITLGQVLLVAQYIRSSVTLTGVVLYIGTALTTGTTGENFIGLYNSSGTQIAVSADATTTFGSTGGKKIPFTSPVAVTAGTYWAAVLNNGATAMQLATRAPNPSGILNIGTGATTYRFAYAGSLTGQTVMPASFTPSANTQAGSAMWVGTY